MRFAPGDRCAPGSFVTKRRDFEAAAEPRGVCDRSPQLRVELTVAPGCPVRGGARRGRSRSRSAQSVAVLGPVGALPRRPPRRMNAAQRLRPRSSGAQFSLTTTRRASSSRATRTCEAGVDGSARGRAVADAIVVWCHRLYPMDGACQFSETRAAVPLRAALVRRRVTRASTRPTTQPRSAQPLPLSWGPTRPILVMLCLILLTGVTSRRSRC
jgi:hypothetical protein